MSHFSGMPYLSPLAFLGMGDMEMLVVVGAILIFFGGEKMPELAKGLGKLLKEFKKATGEVEREFKRVMDEAEHQTVTPFKEAMAPIIKSNPLAQPATPISAAPVVPESPPVATAPPAAPPAPPPASPFLSSTIPEADAEYHSDL